MTFMIGIECKGYDTLCCINQITIGGSQLEGLIKLAEAIATVTHKENKIFNR